MSQNDKGVPININGFKHICLSALIVCCFSLFVLYINLKLLICWFSIVFAGLATSVKGFFLP